MQAGDVVLVRLDADDGDVAQHRLLALGAEEARRGRGGAAGGAPEEEYSSVLQCTALYCILMCTGAELFTGAEEAR